MKKNMKKRTVWIKARNKKVTKRRARFEKQIARAFLREDSKKRVAILLLERRIESIPASRGEQ